jgi:flagellar protein FlaI
MLGWRILGHGEYRVDLPQLSEDEERLVSDTEARFREASRTRSGGRDESRRMIAEMLSKAAAEGGIYLGRAQEGYLADIAFMHIYGYAFIEPLLEDPAVEEISVIGPGMPVYVYVRKEGWKSVNACFEDERSIGDMINRMARSLGRRITMQNPRLDAMLPDGSRLHASLSPVSGGEMTIRKFRDRPFSPRELIDSRTVPAEAMALLSVLMQCDLSVLVAGNTASGKTTTLNSLFSFVPSGERVVITEETPEISIPHRHQLRLVANREMGITLKDLVYDSLRMRPDRMIVGEVRNRDEAEALFDVLLAGQARGSYATFHAQSAAEALSRLRSFGIMKDDLSSVDCIVVQRRMLRYDPRKRQASEVRRVVEMATVEDGKARPVYAYGGRLARSALEGKAAESFGMGLREMAIELGRRRKLLASLEPDFSASFSRIQQELYGGRR